MHTKIRLSLLAFSLLFASSLSAIAQGSSYVHPKVYSNVFHIGAACIMPVEASLSRLGMKGEEGMTKEADTWSTQLQSIVDAHLKQAGITTVAASSLEGSSASDQEVAKVLLQLQEKYSAIAPTLNRKPKDIGKSRFTLGDDVSLLPCAAKTDVLIFVKAGGEVVTGGKKTLSFFAGDPSVSGASLVLTMADAKTGEILAYASVYSGGNFVADPEKAFGERLDKQLTKMKIGTPAPAKGKS